MLAPGGPLAVISFPSLEGTASSKQFLRKQAQGLHVPHPISRHLCLLLSRADQCVRRPRRAVPSQCTPKFARKTRAAQSRAALRVGTKVGLASRTPQSTIGRAGSSVHAPRTKPKNYAAPEDAPSAPQARARGGIRDRRKRILLAGRRIS